ncbi:MAG: hypothetical protein KC609_01395 [Myxococcales bacterium]|nr:hypothetical protein [Myxococcales bacterium]
MIANLSKRGTSLRGVPIVVGVLLFLFVIGCLNAGPPLDWDGATGIDTHGDGTTPAPDGDATAPAPDGDATAPAPDGDAMSAGPDGLEDVLPSADVDTFDTGPPKPESVVCSTGESKEIADATWTADNIHRVGCRLVVTGNLQIKPGTRVEFESDAGIVFRNGGTLTALATSADPISLVSHTPGETWGALVFESSATGVNATNLIVANGGQAGFSGAPYDAAVVIHGTLSLRTMQGCEIRDSASHGIAYLDGASPDFFVNGRVVASALAPIVVGAELVPGLGAENVYLPSPYSAKSDEYQYILLLPPKKALSGVVEWPNVGLPYRLDANLLVEGAETTFTLAPGVRLELGVGRTITVHKEAAMVVNAGATSPVTLAAIDPSGKGWGGLRFEGDAFAWLRYARIENAGNVVPSEGLPNAALVISWVSTVKQLKHVSITDSRGYGLAILASYLETGAFANNSVEGSALAPLLIEPIMLPGFTASVSPGSYQSSTSPWIEVIPTDESGGYTTLTLPLHLVDLGIPYRFFGTLYVEGASDGGLTIDAGVALELDGPLVVTAGGVLEVLGTQNAPVTLSPHGPSGFGGLRVESTARHDLLSVEYLVLTKAGANASAAIRIEQPDGGSWKHVSLVDPLAELAISIADPTSCPTLVDLFTSSGTLCAETGTLDCCSTILP